MSNTNAGTIAWRRQVKASLSPKYLRLVQGHSKLNEASKSKTVSEIVKQYYDAMPENELSKIQEFSKT